ncbi:MAG: hypothetical protein ACREGC_03585, partial [Minisyncoccia bacterium]
MAYFPESKVIHRRLPQKDADAFYFPYGIMVVWGLTRSESEGLIKETLPYGNKGSRHELEFDEQQFDVGPEGKVVNDV